MRAHVPFAIIFAVTQFAASMAVGAQTSWEESTADFIKVCVAHLLQPKKLSEVLKERGLTQTDEGSFGPGWNGTVYQNKDASRNISISREAYSDLRISRCLTVASQSSSREELVKLRTQLEADPRIGKLDGKIVNAGSRIKLAMLKRPGNDPIIIVGFTSTTTATTLTISRWDIRTGH